MENPNNSLNTLLDEGKGNENQTQIRIIYEYLLEHTATASMISDATEIKQKNICRRKRDLEKLGILWQVERKTCKVTGYKAWYLTTNPELTPINLNQLKLF